MNALVKLILIIGWIAGIVLAKGFWSTLFAFIPFWSWYLVIERILQSYGII